MNKRIVTLMILAVTGILIIVGEKSIPIDTIAQFI